MSSYSSTTINDDNINNSSRPGSSRSQYANSRTNTPHHRQSSSSTKGQTFRDMQANAFPAPNGKKHIVMGKKIWSKLVASNPKLGSIESAVSRGVIKRARKITAKSDKTLNKDQKAEIVRLNKRRLEMMTDYFDEKMKEYADMIEKCEQEAMQKRERLRRQGIQQKNARSPFIMSCTFYAVLTYGSGEAYKAYRKLRISRR